MHLEQEEHSYSYEWFDYNFNSLSNNDSLYNVSTGSYFVEIMDANGCDTFTTVQVISSQLPLTASPQVYGVSCRGDSTGMIIADGGGSFAPYKYFWMGSSGDTLRYTGLMMGRDTLRDLPAGSYRATHIRFAGMFRRLYINSRRACSESKNR